MLLGLDLGTGSVKAVLLEENGRILKEASSAYAVDCPQPLWAETKPTAWWTAVQQVVQQVCIGNQNNIAAIGLSGQMHGVVLCDASGQALRNAILWADGRSHAELERLRQLEPKLQTALANPLVVGMSAPTLLWLQTHEPESYQSARYALQPKDWLACQLTGTIQTDHSDASATLLYDLLAQDWHWGVVEALGLRQDLLPPLSLSSSLAGTLTTKAALDLGLPAGIPVATGAADTAAAMVGSGLLQTNQLQLTIGTGAQVVQLLESPQPDAQRRTHLYRTALAPHWYAMAAMQNAGLALERVRGWLGLSWQEAYQLAFSAPVGSDGLMFYPYLTGERSPHNNPELRGAWTGLSLSHEKQHIMRSAFEGVAFSLRDGLAALESGQPHAQTLRLAGGGTLRPEWQQLLANVLGYRLLAVDASSASGRGAALLAGMAIGLWTDLEPLAPDVREIAVPDSKDSRIYEQSYQHFKHHAAMAAG